MAKEGQAQPPHASAARKPMYEDHHSSASCLLARVRNQHHLNGLSSVSQFKWLHRFYLVVDRVVEQHRVYKLFGGPQGFMVSSNVAESDPDHATTLYRFVRHLIANLQHLHLPGGHPVDMVMALCSGEMASGLLGTTSLTYQLVGRPVAVAKELVDLQLELKLMITSEFYDAMEDSVAVASDLRLVGRYTLSTTPGEVAIYTLAGHEGERLYSLEELAELQLQMQALDHEPPPAPVASLPCPATPALPLLPAAGGADGVPGEAAGAAASAAEGSEDVACCSKDGLRKGVQGSKDAAGPQGLGKGKGVEEELEADEAEDVAAAIRASREFTKDIFLAYADPAVEERYLSHQASVQLDSDAMWSVFGFLMSLVYITVARAHGSGEGIWQMLPMQLIPSLMLKLRHSHQSLYQRHRDDAWFVHRLLLVLTCSWPGSFVYSRGISRAALTYGIWAVLYDVLGHRLRFRMQLASSVVLHIACLFVMGMHKPGVPGREKLDANFLAVHFGLTVLLPCLMSFAWDAYGRRTFEAAEREGERRRRGRKARPDKADERPLHPELAGSSGTQVVSR